jgi:hypothetical protein
MEMEMEMKMKMEIETKMEMEMKSIKGKSGGGMQSKRQWAVCMHCIAFRCIILHRIALRIDKFRKVRKASEIKARGV